MQVSPEYLLTEDWAREKRKLIQEKALLPPPSPEVKGGTVNLCSAVGE